MAAVVSLIPELDDIVRNGTPGRRARAIGRLADLFLEGASSFGTAHVALFDEILLGLIPATPVDIRAELARRLAALVTSRGFHRDRDLIALAEEYLTQSP